MDFLQKLFCQRGDSQRDKNVDARLRGEHVESRFEKKAVCDTRARV
jgi:hypothetical protein